MKKIDAHKNNVLGRLASIAAGYPFRGKIDALPEGDVSVIQMRNTDPEAGIDWAALSRIDLPRPSAKSLLRAGDIILSTRGGRNFPYFIEKQAEHVVCSPHFFVIRAKTNEILPQFLAWQMRQRPTQDYFTAGSTGSYILNLKRDVVENLPITIPPIAEQQRIADLDDAAQAERKILTRLIENRNTEMNAIAQRLLSATFQHPELRA